MKIAHIKISTKKGHEQLTRWEVSQGRPFPDMDHNRQWRNAGQLLPKNNGKPSIGSIYYCSMLRSDFQIETATGNRNDYAGFSPGLVYNDQGQRVVQPEHPGSIVLRGNSLGELSVNFEGNPEYPDIKVRGGFNQSPTPTERDWIKTSIVPALHQFIADNAAELKADAVASLKKETAERLAGYRADIDRMEKQINEAIANL